MIILGTNSIKDTGYDVDNSLRFNSGSSDYLNRTLSTPTNNKIYTWSGWFKKTTVGEVAPNIFGAHSGGLRDSIRFDGGGNALQMIFNEAGSGNLVTTQLLRDVSAWYHLVVAVDTTQSTATNRVKMYLNGNQITSFSTSTYPAQNYVNILNSAVPHVFGKNANLSNEYFNGYIAETVFIDGQQLTPTSFGEFDEDSGIWKPIDVSGLTFGDNGFYLDFENSGSLGADVSGNGNNFTVNNLTAVDQSTDTCTNNFATGNPLSPYVSRTISEGNLVHTSTTTHWTSLFSTIGVSSGKWWIELKATAGVHHSFGIVNDFPVSENGSIGDFTSIATQQYGYYSNSGTKKTNETTAAYGDTWTNGDIINMSLNLDDNELKFYKNGVVQNSGTAISLASGYTYFVGASVYNSSAVSFNFGNPSFTISSGNADGDGYGNFEYAVPSGYYALCTKNLAEYG